MIRLLLAGAILFAWTSASAEPVEIKIGYLRGTQPKTSISLVDIPAENNGIAGAQLAINDNNTTGKFLDQRFSLEEVQLKEKGRCRGRDLGVSGTRGLAYDRRSAGCGAA